MRAKDYVQQVRKLDKLIENKLSERQQWYAMATSTTGAAALDTGVRVQSTGNPQRMTAAIDTYMQIDDEIADSIGQLRIKRQQIISVIEQLDATEYDVLHKIYVGKVKNGRMYYMSLKEVAAVYGLSYSWATTIHGLALKNVQRIIDKQEM